MKLVYIIAQGHTGSTLMDCILGTHPEFISNGELMYLNWQLERTKDQKKTKWFYSGEAYRKQNKNNKSPIIKQTGFENLCLKNYNFIIKC